MTYTPYGLLRKNIEVTKVDHSSYVKHTNTSKIGLNLSQIDSDPKEVAKKVIKILTKT